MSAEIDCLLFKDNKFGPRTRETPEADNRLTAALIQRMDDRDAKIYQKQLKYSIVYALTDAASPDQTLDGALRRAGRFGVEVTLPGLSHALRRRLVLGELFTHRLDLTKVAGDMHDYTEVVDAQLEALWSKISAQEGAENALD